MPQIDLAAEFEKKQNMMREKLDAIIANIGYEEMQRVFGKSALEDSYTAKKHKLTSIENSHYAMRVLEEASDLYRAAKDNHEIIKLDHGPELKIYLTPEAFLQRLADNFSTSVEAMSVITPESALNEVNSRYNARSEKYKETNKADHQATVKNLKKYMYEFWEEGKPTWAEKNKRPQQEAALTHA